MSVGGIEEVGGGDSASPEGVEAASVEVISGGGGVGEVAFFGDGEGFPDAIWLVGVDGWSADFGVE